MSIKAEVSVPQAGQPDSVSGEGAQVQEQVKPILTKEDIRAVVEETLDGFNRKQQSARDKQEARFNKQLQAVQSSLKAAGVDMSTLQPDQMRAVEQSIRQHVIAEDASPDQPAQAEGKEQPVSGKATADADTFAAHIEEAFGLELTDADPEAAKVKEAKTLPEFKKAYREALEGKRERMAQQEKANAANRLVGASSGGLGAESIDGLTARLTQLIEHPNPANLKEIKDVQRRLADLTR